MRKLMQRKRVDVDAPGAFSVNPVAMAIVDGAPDDATAIRQLVDAGFDPASAAPLVALMRLIATI